MVSLSINTLSPKNLLMSFNKSLIITSKFTINHLVKKMTETVLERGIREKTVRASTLPVKYNPINWVTWQQRTSDPRISHSPEVSSHYYGYCQHSSTMSLIKYLSCNYLYRYIYIVMGGAWFCRAAIKRICLIFDRRTGVVIVEKIFNIYKSYLFSYPQ